MSMKLRSIPRSASHIAASMGVVLVLRWVVAIEDENRKPF